MGLTDYEKALVDVLSKHPDINTREFIRRSGLGKDTFYNHLRTLESAGFIEYKMIKNRKVWTVARKDKEHGFGMPDPESFDLDKKYFRIESRVMASLRKIRKAKLTSKIDAYGDAVVLIAANIASINLLTIYRNKRVPPSYAKFTKRLEILLEKISSERFFSDYGFGKTAVDVVAFGAESRIDEFLGIKISRKKSVY
ncbi:MAG: hypothetical protein QXN55_07280 [Candidatus Nitrosotenuis sp.]